MGKVAMESRPAVELATSLMIRTVTEAETPDAAPVAAERRERDQALGARLAALEARVKRLEEEGR